MSSFPRFSSGSLGRLSFEHVNEMLDTLERLRPLLKYAPEQFTEGKAEYLWARIVTSSPGGAHEWEEVVIQDREHVYTSPRFEVRTGGRKSGTSADGDKYQPAFSPMPFDWDGVDAFNLMENSIVLLYRFSGKDGKIGWLIVGTIEGKPSIFPAVIKGFAAAPGEPANQTEVRRWYYSWREATLSRTQVAGVGSVVSFVEQTTNGRAGGSVAGATYQPAINGCERSGITGIGGGIPQGTYERPAPISVGTVVMLQTSGDLAYFSIPNGMFVSCTPI